MPHFIITGGIPLHGEVRCSGAKNAALPIMAASLLASEPVRLENVPHLLDVRTQAAVLRGLGMRVLECAPTFSPLPLGEGPGVRAWRNDASPATIRPPNRPHPNPLPKGEGTGAMLLETVDSHPVRASEKLVRQMRASFCVLGPLLARRGRAIVPLPGGCNIGNRPIDLHLKGLAALGADLRLQRGFVVATAQRLIGAEIDMAGPYGPTVTGTANVLSAATLARGKTVIHRAAVEPEIVDLGNFLIALGAKIDGLGTPTIRIQGVKQLGGATHRLIPDRIEAATLLMAVAITGGSATVTDVCVEHIAEVLKILQATGAEVSMTGDRVSITAQNRPHAVDLVAEPYPGLPTDIQAQWTALMSIADGVCKVRDRVFPHRFQHIAELNRLGAKITCIGDTATIAGVSRLSDARVTACDLRASAALVLAGLAAEGRTRVDHIHHLDRGYQRLDRKLRQLGAQIERIAQPSKSGMPIIGDLPQSFPESKVHPDDILYEPQASH